MAGGMRGKDDRKQNPVGPVVADRYSGIRSWTVSERFNEYFLSLFGVFLDKKQNWNFLQFHLKNVTLSLTPSRRS